MAKSRKQKIQKTSRIVRNTSVLAAVSAVLAACGGSNSSPPPVTPPPAPSVAIKGTVTAAAFTPGSATEPTLAAGYYQGAAVCIDANNNGKCDTSENPVMTDANGAFTLMVSAAGPIIADIGTAAVNTSGGATNPTRNVFRALLDQVNEQSSNVIVSPLSTEVARLTEANSTDYQTEKQNLATRLDVTLDEILSDAGTQTGATQVSLLKESNILTRRFAYAITKLDRGDLYPDAQAFPGGDPELTGLTGVTAATASVVDTRKPITFTQAEQAAFNVEGIPRYDHIFIVMLENKATSSILNSPFAPKINAYLKAGNTLTSYYATGNPSEPNYTALGGGDDFGITDDSQWNCDATGPNAVQDLPQPTSDQPGLASSPFTATCTQSVGVNHNIVGRPNLFNAITTAGMTWRTYSESINPGQDFRTDSVADPAVIAQDHVYQVGTAGGNTAAIGDPNLVLPLPAALYKTKHHPGMAYQNVRSAPEFKYSNRTLGGSQWEDALKNTTTYAIPPGYDFDQFGSDLVSGNVGNLNFVIPDQCDDMHGITVQGTDVATSAKVTASDCSSVPNNVANATGGAIITRGDNYVDLVVRKIEASPLWNNPQQRVAIVMMFDEGNATSGFNSCCGWNVSNSTVANPLKLNADGTWSIDTTIAHYSNGNRGHGQSIWGLLTNQANAPKGVSDSDVYSHFSFVRTLQDMFQLADPAVDSSYMNRSKYTEKFIAQNILNLPEYAGSADTHFDSVRPANHAYAIPVTYTQKQSADVSVAPQVGADSNQTSIWALSK